MSRRFLRSKFSVIALGAILLLASPASPQRGGNPGSSRGGGGGGGGGGASSAPSRSSSSGGSGGQVSAPSRGGSGTQSQRPSSAPPQHSSPPPQRYAPPSQPSQPSRSERAQPSGPVVRYAPPVRDTAPRSERHTEAPRDGGGDAGAATPQPTGPSRRVYDTSRKDDSTNPRGDATSDGPDLSHWGRPTRTSVPVLSGSPRSSAPATFPRERTPATDRAKAPTGRIDRSSILERYRGGNRTDRSGISTTRAPSTSGRDLSYLRDKDRGDLGVLRKAPPAASAPGDRRRGDTRTPPIRGTEGTSAKGTRGSGIKTRDDGQLGSVRRIDRLAAKDPTKASGILKRGRELSVATDAAVRTAVGVGVNFACGGNAGNSCFWDPCHQWTNHCAPFWNWWWSPGCSWWWSSCCCPWWGWGYGCGSSWGNCGWYGGYSGCWSNVCYAPYPIYYAGVVYDTYEPPVHETVYVEPPAEEVAQTADSSTVEPGEGSITVAAPADQGAIGGARGGSQGAATRHLELGDTAFRESRYSDAVHEYAKAVELEPGEGVLHLILSDALFATGDYHYAAYALRRALELDPTLVDSVVDKHSFYGDPAEFDRQLDLLERYLEDHFLDDDARLLLSANYLFGAKVSQAADLLQSPFSLATKDSAAGKILLERATRLLRGPGSESGK